MKRINLFLGTIFLPLVWMALTGSFTLANFVIGLFLSSLVLLMTAPRREVFLLVYLVRLFRWLSFFLFFLWELLLATLRVVHDILTPRHRMRPAILAVPLSTRSDLEISVLASFITMTPGTLTLEVTQDRSLIFVHAMYVDDPEQFRRRVKEYEERIRRLFR